jgi:pyruvate/2-oxoacid:ferredoxin oxidoreductase alpha subunit
VTLGVAARSNANVSLASNSSFVVAVWSASLAGGGTDIYTAVSVESGATFSAQALNAAERAAYPVLAVSDGSVLLAFTAEDASSSVIRVVRMMK